jgi:hypothetical protein
MHFHIIACRIDPTTGKTYSDSEIQIKSQAWSLKWEYRGRENETETRRKPRPRQKRVLVSYGRRCRRRCASGRCRNPLRRLFLHRRQRSDCAASGGRRQGGAGQRSHHDKRFCRMALDTNCDRQRGDTLFSPWFGRRPDKQLCVGTWRRKPH